MLRTPSLTLALVLKGFVDTQMVEVNAVCAVNDKLTAWKASLPVCLTTLCRSEGTQAYKDPPMHGFVMWVKYCTHTHTICKDTLDTRFEITSNPFSSCSHTLLEAEGGYVHLTACQLFAWMPWLCVIVVHLSIYMCETMLKFWGLKLAFRHTHLQTHTQLIHTLYMHIISIP